MQLHCKFPITHDVFSVDIAHAWTGLASASSVRVLNGYCASSPDLDLIRGKAPAHAMPDELSAAVACVDCECVAMALLNTRLDSAFLSPLVRSLLR